MYIYMCMHDWMFGHVFVWGEDGYVAQGWQVSSNSSSPCVWDRETLNPELTPLASLSSQLAQGVSHLHLLYFGIAHRPPSSLGIYKGSGDPNSGSPTCGTCLFTHGTNIPALNSLSILKLVLFGFYHKIAWNLFQRYQNWVVNEQFWIPKIGSF